MNTALDLGAVKTRVYQIIRVADLETCTSKSIRRILQDEFNVDLEPHKQKINELINEAIYKRLADEETAGSKDVSAAEDDVEDELDDEALARQLQEEENAKVARKPRATSKVKGKRLVRREGSKPSGATKNAFNQPFILSEALSKVVGAPEMSRPQVVKHIWAYVKQHNLQDPADKRIILCDEPLMAVMKKPKINCFAMNKVLSDHLMKRDDMPSPSTKRTKTMDEETAEEED